MLWMWVFTVPTDSTSKGYDGASDIITDGMIAHNPRYLNRYTSGLVFTKSSNYISPSAYKALKRKDVKVKMPKSELKPLPASAR